MFKWNTTCVWKVVRKETSTYGEYYKSKYIQKLRNLRYPSFKNDTPIGYFDGTSQEVGINYGAGAILELDDSRFF